MEFLSFLQTCQSSSFFEHHKTVCLRMHSEALPLLFLSTCMNKIKKSIEYPVESVSLTQTEGALVIAKLATSFLGNVSVYWLKDIGALKPKKSKELLDFLKTYDGPNAVVCVVDETVPCNASDFQVSVTLPDKIGPKEFASLFTFFYGAEEKLRSEVVTLLFKKVKMLNLDNACLVMQYLRLAGRGAEDFLHQWTDKLIASEHSLVTLSGHFFARDKQQFFLLWKEMESDYSAQFWISFWSEQLWRAYNFVEQVRRQNHAEAKRISYRLPYNFIQKIWAQANLAELRNAHDFIYSIDGALKNGGAETSLELLYTNFFTGQFQPVP